MEGSFLSPQENKYYSELFTRYDAENTGKLTNNQALVLFDSSNVQTNQLKLISELCGAERVGHYGRSQFFIALKLIALVQSGKPLPTSIDNNSLGLEVPLPTFGEKSDDQGIDAGMQEFENPVFVGNARDSDFNGMNGSGILPPPQISRSSGVSGNVILQSINEQDGSSPQDFSPSSSPSASPEPLLANASSPHSALAQEPVSPVGVARTVTSPTASTPAPKKSADGVEETDAGGPSQAVDEGWAEFDKTRSKVSNPPNDMDSSWATFPPSSEETEDHTEEKKEKVDAAKGKEEEDADDPWVITKEQRKYYTTQFQNLQKDLALSIKGPDAKAFFEKSKLPTYELSQIWQLSDVNKDGTLYLEEFCTAMHLVVLRKHDISLPEKLPASLIPKIGRSITPPSSESEVKSDENWATFQDSPFPGPPSPSSQTPVNFDFASISPDPDAKIFQPIPVHLGWDGKPLADDSEQPTERPRTFSDPLQLERQPESVVPKSPTKQRSLTHADTIDSTPTKIAPPPSAQKLRGNNTMHLEGQDRATAGEPGRPSRPLIPPRPGAQNQEVNVQYTHTPRRTMSVDERQSHRTDKFQENRLYEVQSTENDEKEGPPQLPPRPPLPEELQQDVSLQKSPERHHSVDLEKDKAKEESLERRRHLSAPTQSSKRSKPKDRKAVQAAILAAKEENVTLSRLNNERHQELSQLTEDRVVLEAQLQKLRPFHKINNS